MTLIPECKSYQAHVLLDELPTGYLCIASLTDREWDDLRLMFIRSRLGR